MIPKINPYDSSKGQISYHSELILLCKKTISPFLKMNPSCIGKIYHPYAKVIIHRQELSSSNGVIQTAVNVFTSLQFIKLLKMNVVENVFIINQRIPIMIFMLILYFLRANSACPEGSREWVTTWTQQSLLHHLHLMIIMKLLVTLLSHCHHHTHAKSLKHQEKSKRAL